MSETISFVARDELAEWLESRADEEMKSVSAVCQDIVAAECRRQMGSETSKSDDTGAEEQSSPAGGDALDRHPDAWYRPDGKYDFAVRHPEKEQRKYYKTRDGAGARIRRWYEGEEIDGRSV